MTRVLNLAALTEAQMEFWLAGYASGYSAGVERGRELQEEEIAALQAEAARIVHHLAGAPNLGQEISPEGARERRRASIEAFRADHARRRQNGGAA